MGIIGWNEISQDLGAGRGVDALGADVVLHVVRLSVVWLVWCGHMHTLHQMVS